MAEHLFRNLCLRFKKKNTSFRAERLLWDMSFCFYYSISEMLVLIFNTSNYPALQLDAIILR